MKKLLVIVILSFIAFWANNRVIYPDIMESRNIVTAREMVRVGNYLIPTMNGELRLEKPPLPTWIAAMVESVSPDNLALQRGAAGLAGVMLVVFFYLIGRRATRSERYAFLSSLIFLTCYNVVFMGRTASWDIYCHAFMLGAIYYLMRGLAPIRRHYLPSLIAAGVLLGLSFLGKGPVAFYTLLLPLVIMCILMRRVPVVLRGRCRGLALTAVICVAISSWWYIYIYVFHAEETAYVLGKESNSWLNHNVRPWWYYWKFFLETGIWSLLMLSTLASPYWIRRVRFPRKYLFFLGWAMISLVLLSLMPEKKSRYLLPLLIPCSYAMGFVYDYWASGKWFTTADKWIYRINAGLIAAVVGVVPLALYKYVYLPNHISLLGLIALSVIILSIAFVMFMATIRLHAKTFLFMVVLLFVVIEVLLMPYVGYVANNMERYSISSTRQNAELSGLLFYHDSRQPIRIEIIYAADRTIRPIDVLNADTLIKYSPLVLVTHEEASRVLPDSIKQHFVLREIGKYDDNPRPQGNRRYSDAFVYTATLLTVNTANYEINNE